MAGVTLKNLTKRFGKVTAVNRANLEIRDGEFIILLGPSGCGKSTMLYSIAGLEDITEGEIYIGERLMNRVPPKARNIAMVFQDYALYPHMNVYDNMAFGLKLRKASRQEIERRVHEAAALLGIGHLLQRRPRELSGGQRQRVALGRAIVREPDVFLMDEPLSNLDAILRVQMRAEISKLHQRLQTTFIYVTHDQVEAMTMGDRIVVLKDGVIQQVGTPQEVYAHPANVFVAGFIGTPSMNFMTGRLTPHGGTLAFDAGTFRVPLPRTSAEAAARYADRAVIAGVRPSTIHVLPSGSTDGVKPPEGGVVAAKVDVVEPMGDVAYIFADVGGQSFTVRVDPTALPVVGQVVPLRLDGAALHLFDAETQQAIASPTREPAATVSRQ
jgi:multiple sugar transport system ATP-binding protein